METVKNNSKHSTAITRTVTSVVYMVVVAALCALKWCVPFTTTVFGTNVYWGSLGFDAVFCAISVLGCLEFLRAVDSGATPAERKISLAQRTFTIAFCAVTVPLYVILEITWQAGLLAMVCAFAVYFMCLAATSVFDHEKSSVKGTTSCVFCMLYCGILSTLLTAINHLEKNSMSAMLVLIICTVFTDAGAYIIGTIFKRWIPLKLAPQLSPNKTVIGAVGGVLGGILGAIIAYYIMYLCGGMNSEIYVWRFNEVYLEFASERIHPLVSFILVGLGTAVLAMIGDLFESAIKRECGIKDMGNLLPGHGGVLDRFDSMLYCGVLVLLAFGTIIA